MDLNNKRILLIIGGGIAAYKSIDLIRRLRERGAKVRAILTEGGAQFITPLSVAAISGDCRWNRGQVLAGAFADIVRAPVRAGRLARCVKGSRCSG